MIIEVIGKEIEKIKGDFESYLNGLNMVGEISYSQYSELYNEGTKQIQRAYELGKTELEKENAELRRNEFNARSCLELQQSQDKAILNCMGEQLTKAKDHIKTLLDCLKQDTNDPQTNYYVCQYMDKAEQFLQDLEK